MTEQSIVGLPRLLERGYLLPRKYDGRVYDLRCSLRMFPMLRVEDVLNTLVAQKHLTKEGKCTLVSQFPERVPRNWNASEYIALARKPKNESDDLVWRQVPDQLLDLGNMGADIELGKLD